MFSLVPAGSSASILRVDVYDSSLAEKQRILGSVKANILALSDIKQEHWFKIHPSKHATLVSGELRLILQYCATTVCTIFASLLVLITLQLTKQGYLYKKSSGLLGTYNKRMFYLLDGMLLYAKVTSEGIE